jgi:hypothetical protein
LLVNTGLPQMRSSGSMMAADLIAVQLRKHASAAPRPRSAIAPGDPIEVVAIHQKPPAGPPGSRPRAWRSSIESAPPAATREFGSVIAFEVLDIARQDNDDVVVASRHQEASNHRWTVDDRGFERFQRLLVLTFQGDPDQNGGGETEAPNPERPDSRG